MLRYIGSAIALLALVGCAGVPPMPTTSVDDLKKGKTAVVFYDGAQKIHYVEDKYYVLAIAKVATESTYDGFWDSHRDLSRIHAAEFSRIGLRAQAAYDALSQHELTEFLNAQKQMSAATLVGEVPFSKILKPKHRVELMAKGYDHLIWITWLGYHLYIPALGLPPTHSFQASYVIHNLKRNTTVWQGSIAFRDQVEIPGASAKAYLEGNDMAGLRSVVTKLIKDRYTIRPDAGGYSKSVGQFLGIEPLGD